MLVEPNTLSMAQWKELEEGVRTTRDIKVYRRAKVILLRNSGYTADEIQEYTDYSERAQQYWLLRYREEGISGLYERPRSGRPQQKVTSEPQSDVKPEFQSDVTPELQPDVTPEPQSKATPDIEYAVLMKHVQLTWLSKWHSKPYLRERAQMVLLRDDGYSLLEIARILHQTVRTVQHVLTNYDREGGPGLFRKPGSGRISALRPDHWEQVKEWVETGPKALGYRFVKWTTRSLRKYIYKRFNILFSREWIRQTLHHVIDYSWTRGKKGYAYPDEKKRNKERKRFAQQMLTYLELARKGEIILLFEDESIFTLFGEVGYSWSPLGKTQEVPSAGKRGRVVVFGAANPQSGRVHSRIEDENINQESTLRFVKQLVRYYHKHAPGIPLVIVLDKHPGHTSALVEDFVAELDHVTLENSPTQSPDLNPIERLWDWLAELMVKNDFFETIPALKHAIRHFFCYIAGVKEQVIRCLGDLQKIYSTEAQKEVEI